MRWSPVVLLCLFVSVAAQAQAEPLVSGTVARADLAGEGSFEGAQRVLRFVQVSDAHILDDDAPYPLRQEPLDPYITAFSSSAQRPQDEFTDEVLESIVRAVNDQHGVDPFQFVLNTGDNIDNDLENELMRFIDLWEGTSTTTGPVSGLACLPDGQSTGIDDASHDVTDQCTSLPESLLAQRTALAPGLPWYSAFGNHDTLIQGNVNPNGGFDDVAARSGRHLLTQPEYVAMHFGGGSWACDGTQLLSASTDNDMGHGYGLAGERLCDDDPDNDGYYAFTLNGVRFVVLDTVNDDFASANGFTGGVLTTESIAGADVIGGYAEGAVDPAQLAWLREEVAANADKLIVVSSHHTVNSMFTRLRDDSCAPGLGCLADAFERAGYATGEQLTAELAEVPNVVAWVGGHTHRHRIEPKDGAAGGFWNIESSSLIDWPQQARSIELWVTADGAKGFWLLRSFGHDYQASKDLEATDPQREEGASGSEVDGDVVLWFDVPEGVNLTPEAPPAWRARLVAPSLETGYDGESGGFYVLPSGQGIAARFHVDDANHPARRLPPQSAIWAIRSWMDAADREVTPVSNGTGSDVVIDVPAEGGLVRLLLVEGVGSGGPLEPTPLLEASFRALEHLDDAVSEGDRGGKGMPAGPLGAALAIALALRGVRRR